MAGLVVWLLIIWFVVWLVNQGRNTGRRQRRERMYHDNNWWRHRVGDSWTYYDGRWWLWRDGRWWPGGGGTSGTVGVIWTAALAMRVTVVTGVMTATGVMGRTAGTMPATRTAAVVVVAVAVLVTVVEAAGVAGARIEPVGQLVASWPLRGRHARVDVVAFGIWWGLRLVSWPARGRLGWLGWVGVVVGVCGMSLLVGALGVTVGAGVHPSVVRPTRVPTRCAHGEGPRLTGSRSSTVYPRRPREALALTSGARRPTACFPGQSAPARGTMG